jgi:hypothetical protein
MIDLNQVSLALRNSTPRSLILLDEFGKGTLPTGSLTFSEVSSNANQPNRLVLRFCPSSFCYTLVACACVCSLPTDGAGILCGVLKHFLNRKDQCPKILVTTHFHEIFREDLLNPKLVPISFQHMQVMFTRPSSSSFGSGQNTPTPSTPSSILGSHRFVSFDNYGSQHDLTMDRSRLASYLRADSFGIDTPPSTQLGLRDEITYLYR